MKDQRQHGRASKPEHIISAQRLHPTAGGCKCAQIDR